MPKATKVGKFRAASRASSRDVRAAPLTSQQQSPSSSKNTKDADGGISDRLDANAIMNDAAAPRFPKEGDDAPLSRGQRKRLAKRDQYLKRENMVMSSLRLRRLDDQVGKLDGLDAIREALGEAASTQSSVVVAAAAGGGGGGGGGANKALTCNTNRSKRALANSEISHMGLVLRHPAFNEDPFEAIRQHLRNSLTGDAEKLRAESKTRDEEDGVLEAKKKEEKKERLREAKFSKKKRTTMKSRPRR
ncbi:hypothetical protein ACHAW5_004565 [Stephanodiscus triporus]|uniref:Ribosome biogenesis protein NOP53 n=1 Tax=Stephanodiscus triporus TaxID=2934178 RepID=A0ABD3NYI4_9STRA